MMKSSEILEAVLSELEYNYNELAKALEIPKTQNLYDIRDGKIKKISSSLALKIISKFPQFNMEFLLTGKGGLLKSNEEIVLKATVKMLNNEMAKVKAKVFGIKYEDCLEELDQNTTSIIRDMLKGKS